MDFVFQWIDLAWLLVVPLALGRAHWLTGSGYVVSCALMLRLQTELLDSIGYSRGFLPLLESDIFTRGIITYGVVIFVYMIWGHFLRRASVVIFLAHSIAFFFIAMIASLVVMIL